MLSGEAGANFLFVAGCVPNEDCFDLLRSFVLEQ